MSMTPFPVLCIALYPAMYKTKNLWTLPGIVRQIEKCTSKTLRQANNCMYRPFSKYVPIQKTIILES